MILIVADHEHGALRRSTLELVAFGSSLAGQAGQPLAGLVFGGRPEPAAEQLASFVQNVYVVSDPRLDPPRSDTATRVVAQAAETLGAKVVLVPGSRAGMSYGPRVALRLGGAYIEGATNVDWDGPDVIATRPSHLARFSTTVVADGSGPVVVSTSLGAAHPATLSGAMGSVHVLAVAFEPHDERLEVRPQREFAERRVALEDADVVVCGGRGLASKEAFDRHVSGLAERLGAAVGVTRAVVDAGWRPFEDLIGQTGKVVAPKLCLTLGVSGAPHLLSGLSRSRVIVAVNIDPGAPIFRSADYGIVGDVGEVAPAIEAALAKDVLG